MDRIIRYIIYDDESYIRAKKDNAKKDDKSNSKDNIIEEIPTYYYSYNFEEILAELIVIDSKNKAQTPKSIKVPRFTKENKL